MGESTPTSVATLAVERRRHPRVAPLGGLHVSVPIVMSTEIIDLSSGGALLSTSEPLAIGQRAHLRTLLAGQPFSAWVEVRRVHRDAASARDAGHQLGVAFTALDDASRRTLSRFVKHEDRRP
jgi:c-di-GMP-binding flagellar brake protein YcgR